MSWIKGCHLQSLGEYQEIDRLGRNRITHE